MFTFTGGRKRVNAHTADKMHAALKKHKGDLWGYIVYAHGANNQIGTLHATRRGGPITNAVKIYQDLKGNGFQLSKVWMMQCFSAAHGRDAWWKDVSYRDPKYYFGVNTCGIDVNVNFQFNVV